jgi:hypothetical protein
VSPSPIVSRVAGAPVRSVIAPSLGMWCEEPDAHIVQGDEKGEENIGVMGETTG